MKHAPPLPVWTLSLLAVTSLLGILHWAGERDRRERSEAFVLSQQQRLHAYRQAVDGTPHTVALGNSLLRAATPFEALPGEPPLPWLRIYSPGNAFGQFTGLWPALLSRPPDVLIVHAELLLPGAYRAMPERNDGNLLDDLHDWQRLQEAWRLGEHTRRERQAANANRAQSKAACPAGPSWEKTRSKMQQRYRMTPPLSGEAEAHIRAAAARIPHIVLLDIPRSQSVEQAFGDDTAHWLQGVRTQLADLPNVQVWRLGEALPDDCYCDYRHLEPACQPQMDGAWRALAQLTHALQAGS